MSPKTHDRIGRIVTILAKLWALALLAKVLGIVLVLNVRGYDSWPSDFTVLWTVAELGLEGRAVEAFDDSTIGHVWEKAGYGEGDVFWLYPPTTLLFFLPFGAMPFSMAIALYTLGTILLLAWSMRGVAAQLPGGVMMILASPAVPLAANLGNTSLLVAAAFAAAAAGLRNGDDRQTGLSVASLVIKPQFGVIFPLALAALGRWRAFAWAAAGTVTLTVIATLVVEPGYWPAFIDKIVSHGTTEEHWIYLSASPFTALRIAGVGSSEALIAHGIIALTMLGLTIWTLFKKGPTASAVALLILTAMLIIPRTHYYDHVVTLVAFAYLWQAGAWRTVLGKTVLAVLWLSPASVIPGLFDNGATVVMGWVAFAGAVYALWLAWEPAIAGAQDRPLTSPAPSD